MIVDQTAFHVALRDPSETIPEGLLDNAGAPAGRRFNVYRNNVTTSLMDALQDGFPVIRKLLGEANFRNLARDFQAGHPPSTPLMMLFGEDFPNFIRGHAGLAKIPYLGDVAELEFALRRSYHAADSKPIDASVLGQMEEPQLLASTFELSPALQLVSSDWPVLGIWQFNALENAPKPKPGGQCVLITRLEFDPQPEEITQGDASFLQAVKNGRSLEQALLAASSAEEGHDFGRLLGRLLAGGAITKINSKD